MNKRDPQALFEILKALPPQRLAEVEAFVDFLRTRGEDARDSSAEWLEKAKAVLEKRRPQRMNEGWLAEIRAARQKWQDPMGADRPQRLPEDEVQAIREARRKWRDLWGADRR